MRWILIGLALLPFTSLSASAAWTFEIVDVGNVGAHCSMKIAPGDGIHVAHFASSVGHLKYSHYDGTAWTNETADGQYLSGQIPSIDLDSGGLPHIIYYFYSGKAIRYTSREGTGWTTSEFEGDPDYEWDFSMKLDASDSPHVSFQDDSYGVQNLAYATYDGTAWTISQIDTPGHCGRGSAITLDANGNPWISYYDETNIRLKVAHYDGTQWVLENLDNVELIGFNFRTAIAVDSLNRIHVVYGAYHNDGVNWRGRLKYALHDGTGWHISTVEEGAPNRDFRIPAIAIDAANRPRLAYYIYFNSEPTGPYLKYAYPLGSGWFNEVVETDGLLDSNYSCAIGVDSHGRPHICTEYNGSLQHAIGDAPADVAAAAVPAGGLTLDPPLPNPSDGEAALRFVLPKQSEAALHIYDVTGRTIATLTRGTFAPGPHEVRMHERLSPGTYFCRLAADGSVASTKLVVR